MRIALPCLAAVVLASCASMSPVGPQVLNQKQVDVKVGPKWFFFGDPEIKLDEVTVLQADTTVVIWSLRATAADRGYRFGEDGIKFEKPDKENAPRSCDRVPDAKVAFSGGCGPLADGLLFRCQRGKEKARSGDCFKYTVKLQSNEEKGGDPSVPPKDPWIKYQ